MDYINLMKEYNRFCLYVKISNILQGLDAGTSDDSGRASEQLHGPGIPRDCQDADSSRDHLSDVSLCILRNQNYWYFILSCHPLSANTQILL